MNTIEKTIRMYESRLERRRKVLQKHLLDAENCQKAISRYEKEIAHLKLLQALQND